MLSQNVGEPTVTPHKTDGLGKRGGSLSLLEQLQLTGVPSVRRPLIKITRAQGTRVQDQSSLNITLCCSADNYRRFGRNCCHHIVCDKDFIGAKKNSIKAVWTAQIFGQVYFRIANCGRTVVKVLCYKSEGRWFDSKWCHWNFSLT